MQLSSKDANFGKIYTHVMGGNMGYALVENDKGVVIVRAYAPIPFRYGVYTESGIFGGVLIGASLNRFNQAADNVGQSIRDQQATLTRTLLTIIGIAIALMIVVAFILARGITTPLRHLTRAAQDMEKGEYDPQKLQAISNQRLQDEVSFLSGVFTTMAQAVQLREKQLKDQVQTLLIQIDQGKKEQQVKEIVETEYFAELQRTAAGLRSRARRASATASPTEPLKEE
jgi:HAMP domain-containing protein